MKKELFTPAEREPCAAGPNGWAADYQPASLHPAGPMASAEAGRQPKRNQKKELATAAGESLIGKQTGRKLGPSQMRQASPLESCATI